MTEREELLQLILDHPEYAEKIITMLQMVRENRKEKPEEQAR